jgi:hypothetical protein
MRSCHLSVLLAAISLSLSGAASACTYHQPSVCGSGPADSDRIFTISDLVGAAAFEDRNDANVVVATASEQRVFGPRGGGQAFGSNVNSQGPGSPGTGSSSPAALSLSSLERLGERAPDGAGPRLALDRLSLIQLAQEQDLPTIGNGVSAPDARATPLPASWSMMLIGLALLAAFAGCRSLKMAVRRDPREVVSTA